MVSNSKSRPIILCFVAYYLPGFRSGGPVRTIANFVDHLGDEFDIRIFTHDRDALDTAPYPGVAVDMWNTVGKARVFYASNRTLTLHGVGRLLSNTPHDVLYLNSFFAYSFTGLPLLARRLGLAPKLPCVIAPRGEFSSGAVALKARKKRLYLSVVKALGLYRGLHWQASSSFEVDDIRREFGQQANVIEVAPNLPPKHEIAIASAQNKYVRKPGPLRIVFLSRISPKKNLDFALRVLAKVQAIVDFRIYGPQEEQAYWQSCMKLIDALPSNIRAHYLGEVHHIQINEILTEHDLFFLPTRGENYGHVIFEALSAGIPVLISNKTPWRDLEAHGIGWAMSLDDEQAFAKRIDDVASWPDENFLKVRILAQKYARERALNSTVLDVNRQLFLNAISMPLA